ncbi:hypothetical protein B0T14DRAFT_569197 [Immersiella caudata]|uniref:Uncharacterized protein n=1 Tax=Immersiella caudata TaxID=314043 RepID=A0AA39WLU1_9PEZI|nr:hypothetical protein B0T14DRAFT_569197 [Immersiella caudata]
MSMISNLQAIEYLAYDLLERCARHLSDYLKDRLGNAVVGNGATDVIKDGFEAIYQHWEERSEAWREQTEVNRQAALEKEEREKAEHADRRRGERELQWHDRDGMETEIGSTNFSTWSGSTAAHSTAYQDPDPWNYEIQFLPKHFLYDAEGHQLEPIQQAPYASFVPASGRTEPSHARNHSELPDEAPAPLDEERDEHPNEWPFSHDCDGRSPDSSTSSNASDNSELSNIFPNSSNDSNTSDLSGISDFFPELPRFLSVESAVVDGLVDAYHSWAQSNTGDPTPEPTGEPVDSPEPSHPGNTPYGSDQGSTGATSATSSTLLGSGSGFQAAPRQGNGPQKRRKDDDDEDLQKPELPKRKRIEAGSRRLACLFQKRYPSKHLFCGTGGSVRGFETIARLKEHIRRRHVRSPIYCPRCKKVFEGSEAKDEHVLQGMSAQPCEERPFEDETALAWQARLASLFKSRVDKALTIQEQWFSLWANVFPGVEPPASCLVDDPVCEHILEYYEFTRARGAEVVREAVRSSGFLPEIASGDAESDGQETPFTELEVFAERIFDLAAERIFRDFHSHREATCVARQGTSTNGNQRPSREGGEALPLAQGDQGPPPTPRTVDPQHLGLQVHDMANSDEMPFDFGALDDLDRFVEGYDPPWVSRH